MGASGSMDRAREKTSPGAKVHILVVEDEKIVRVTLRAHLERQGLGVSEAESLAAARDHLGKQSPSLVLLDMQLPDGHGFDLLTTIKQQSPDIPVIVMTGHGSIETAVNAMRLGADNFVQKPLNFDELAISIRQALETGELRRRVEEDVRRTAARYRFEDIVAASSSMRAVIDQARVVACVQADGRFIQDINHTH